MKRKFNSISECVSLREFKVLKQISAHPNIVQLYESYLSPNKEFYFVMEYINGGNMYQLIKSRRDEETSFARWEIRSIVYQILSGLAHVHSLGIFHRDMKPENLLIDNTPFCDGSHSRNIITVKIADFGLAREMKSRPPYTEYVSTRWYRAPEVLLRSSTYSFPVDLWAVGAMFAELITLRPLFPGQSEIDQVFRICELLGNPGPAASHTGAVQRRMSEKKTSPGFARKRSESIKMEANLVAHNISENSARPEGGGEWREGVKLATKIGFQFPKISPKPLISVIPNATPSMLDLLAHLLFYDPSLRLTAEAAMRHPFFLETEGQDEASSQEGAGDSNQESEDPDHTSPGKKGGGSGSLERHGTNKGIIIADETSEERLKRSHQRLAFISENDHLMRRTNGKKDKTSNKATSALLGKKHNIGSTPSDRVSKSGVPLSLSLQTTSFKAQFDLPVIPLSPFEFGDEWPQQRRSSIGSIRETYMPSMESVSSQQKPIENNEFQMDSHNIICDIGSLSADQLLKETPVRQSDVQHRHNERYSAPSSFQEPSFLRNTQQYRRTQSSEIPILRFDSETLPADEHAANSPELFVSIDGEYNKEHMQHASHVDYFSLPSSVAIPRESMSRKLQGRPLSDISNHGTFSHAFSNNESTENLKSFTSSDAPSPTKNGSLSTPLDSINHSGTIRKLMGRNSSNTADKEFSATIPRSVTYESFQTTSSYSKKQERNGIGHRTRQIFAQTEATSNTSTGSNSIGFFSFRKRSQGIRKGKLGNNMPLRHHDINPLQEDITYHEPVYPRTSRAPSPRPSEYRYRPSPNPEAVKRQPSPFELLIAEEIEQAWAHPPIRIPPVSSELAQPNQGM
ncbi:Serine/threonine protein kinase [Umbelopsis sp. WA50703]